MTEVLCTLITLILYFTYIFLRYEDEDNIKETKNYYIATVLLVLGYFAIFSIKDQLWYALVVYLSSWSLSWVVRDLLICSIFFNYYEDVEDEIITEHAIGVVRVFMVIHPLFVFFWGLLHVGGYL